MSVRFCEFCSTVHPDECTHCPDCGTRLIQAVSEEYFNDPGNPWPFVPVAQLQLLIQGKPRTVRFSGTHSVYHLWSALHGEYVRNALCFHPRGEEVELASYPEGMRPAEFISLTPEKILNSRYRKFSFYTCAEADPDVAEEIGEFEITYHGSFEIDDCPEKYWRDILGWLVATEPRSEIDNNWTYEMT